MKRVVIPSGRPIALYNTIKKELVGVFATLQLAGKYCLPVSTNDISSKILDAVRRKRRIDKTKFDFSIAVRYANEGQLKKLGDDEFYINGSYPIPTIYQVRGFHTGKVTQAAEGWEGLKRWNLEQKRIKSDRLRI